MRTIVRFRTPRGAFALPVEHVAEVRPAAELTMLPAPQAGVAGVLRRGEGVLSVLSVLGEPGGHVIVVDVDGDTFGLLVEEVTGIHRIDDDAVGPPPGGQEGAGLLGAIVEDDGVVLVVDPEALREGLRR